MVHNHLFLAGWIWLRSEIEPQRIVVGMSEGPTRHWICDGIKDTKMSQKRNIVLQRHHGRVDGPNITGI